MDIRIATVVCRGEVAGSRDIRDRKREGTIVRNLDLQVPLRSQLKIPKIRRRRRIAQRC